MSNGDRLHGENGSNGSEAEDEYDGEGADKAQTVADRCTCVKGQKPKVSRKSISAS